MPDLVNLVLADDVPVWLLIFGPAGAVGFYLMVWRSYRNTDKSHSYERETQVTVSDLTGADAKVATNNGTRDRWIRGRNDTNPRQRL